MEKSFLFRGATISYSLKGKGRSLILLHGFLGSKKVWKNYESRLAKSFKVISLDLPGHGNSESIGYVHNMELVGECVQTLLKTLNVRKAIIAGHSLGGYVALAFAEIYPDSVLGLLLINSTSKGDSISRKKSRDQMIKLVKKEKTRAIDLLVPTFFNLKNKNTNRQIASYKKMANLCTERGIVANLEGMKIRKEREIVLKFAPFPYLILAGEHDEMLDWKALQIESNLNSKGRFIKLNESSHMSIYETPELVFKYLKAFAKNTQSIIFSEKTEPPLMMNN